MTAFPKYASGFAENPKRAAENPTATATLRVARDQTDNAQLRSKKTSPDLNYTAESKSLQINRLLPINGAIRFLSGERL